jgi:inhibitor of cysteine peptidase
MKKIFILVTFLITALFLQACTIPLDPKLAESDFGLAVVRDYDELLLLMKENENSLEYRNFTDNFAPESSSTATDDASKDTSSYSKTNVQVKGVDEGDVVKTDGNRIYRVSYNRLVAIDIKDGEMEVVLNDVLDSSNSDTQSTYYSDIYLTDTKLVVIGQRYQYYLMTHGGEIFNSRMDFWYQFGLPQVLVNVYDLETLVLEDTIEISGYYQTTRIINDTLYVISTQDVYTYDDSIDPRPFIALNDSKFIPEYSDIKYIPESVYQAFSVITTIPLSNIEDLKMDVYLGSQSWGNIYVSLKGIYFASNTYFYDEKTQTYTEQGHLMSYVFDEDGFISFGGKAVYQGMIINQFALDQYEDYIRFVTTEGWGDSVKNRLYIYKHDLNESSQRILTQVSLLDEGIGKPRERIQSARFNQTMLTVVTFELTDPLYIIDLTNPEKPVITSEIEVTGYGTYQHPWGEGVLLVIGYETNPEGRIIGLKVSLFDTSDAFNIKEIGMPYVILNEAFGWSYSEALHNHKAMLIDVELGLFGFSTSRYQMIQTTRNNVLSISYEFVSNYLVFDINAQDETSIQLIAELTHTDILKNADDLNFYSGVWAYQIERAVYIGQTLYTLSQGAIKSHDMQNNYETTQVIVFDTLNKE